MNPDDTPRLRMEPEQTVRRSYLNIPELAKAGGFLPPDASPYVINAYRATKREMEMLFFQQYGNDTATVNASVCCGLERTIHGARTFCQKLTSYQTPTPELIAEIWPNLGTMPNEWLTQRIIEQRGADDHDKAAWEVYARQEEGLEELKQWPPAVLTINGTERSGMVNLLQRAEHKRKSKPLSKDLLRHMAVIQDVCRMCPRKRGLDYCRELRRREERTPQKWQDDGCSQWYDEAYKQREWATRINREKYECETRWYQRHPRGRK